MGCARAYRHRGRAACPNILHSMVRMGPSCFDGGDLYLKDFRFSST